MNSNDADEAQKGLTRRQFTRLATVGVGAVLLGINPAHAAQMDPGDSLQNSPARGKIDDLISKMTLDEKIKMLSGTGSFSTRGLTRLGIPSLHMSDASLGVRYPSPTTAYPGGIGLAASWDINLARHMGEQLGRDALSRGVNFLLGPGVNIYRAAMCGRNFEYFGEDPFLAGQIAASYIAGVQSKGVSATVKHFAVHDSNEFMVTTENCIVSERALREIYLPAFEAAVKEAHVGAIMDAYNLINGEAATQNYHLNVEIAKKQWGFDGLIMSDWGATYNGLAAAKAGLDLEMPFGAHMNEKTLVPAVKDGKLSEAEIDEKVRRILTAAFRFGWMEHKPLINISHYNQEGRIVALQGARQSIVLLKNDRKVLPLDIPSLRTVAVIGPDSYPAFPTGGGSGEVLPFYAVSTLQGISDRLGPRVNVLWERGVPRPPVLAFCTPFNQGPGSTMPGMTVEIFDNPAFHGKPIGHRVRYPNPMSLTSNDPRDYSEVWALWGSQAAERYQYAEATAAGEGRASGPRFERWIGYYTANTAGDFVAFVQHRGKYRLTIDDKLVIDQSELPKYALEQVKVSLAQGEHKVVFELLGPIGRSHTHIGILQDDHAISPEAIEIAKKADAVIISVGYNPEIEREGSDREFQLPPGQDEMIEKIAAVNPNTIVVITSGGSVDTSRWIEKVPVLLQAWYSGQEGGTALAEVLVGDIDPSGRLPISWERSLKDNPSHASYYPFPGSTDIDYKNGIFVGYRGYEHNAIKPLFPFGFGLSYTRFKYSNLQVRSVSGHGNYQVSFDVTNIGDRTGADIAQVYVSEETPRVPRPPQELKGFARISLEPGKTANVTVPLNARSFSWYDTGMATWRADAGSFVIRVSRSSAEPQLTRRIVLPQQILSPV